MITDFKEIEHSDLELDKKRRAELAIRLIKSLDEEIDSDIEQAWIDEVTHRKEKNQIRQGVSSVGRRSS